MKNIVKITTVLCLVIVLFGASLVCCCLSSLAHASDQPVSCHQASKPKADHHENDHKDCECVKIINMPFKQTMNSLAVEKYGTVISYPDSFPQIVFSETPVFIGFSPPIKTLPLYLQNATLRL